MIEASATVIEVDGDHARVLMDEAGCGRCHEPGGCGGQNIGKMFCDSPRNFRVQDPVHARVGDRVKVVIAEDSVRRGAVLAYGIPLLALIGGALGGSLIAAEGGAMAGAFLGLLGAWLFLRYKTRAGGTAAQLAEPYIRD